MGHISVIREDTTAQCKWWNSLMNDEREAYVCAVQKPLEYAASEWLDLGAVNRKKILDAAFAVECWCSSKGQAGLAVSQPGLSFC